MSSSSNSSTLINSTSSNSSVSSDSSDSSILINSTSSSDSSNSSLTSDSSNWNIIKPLILGHSATDDNKHINNRVAQTILVKLESISIKKIYCYLYGEYHDKDILPFDIYMGIYLCLDDGTPTTLVSETSIKSSDIRNNDWNEFLFNTPIFAIPNHYISFVMRQSGGDESNYALWGYINIIDESSSVAFISNNGLNWQYINNTCFGLRVLQGNNNIFDLEDGKVITEIAKLIKTDTSLLNLQNSTSATIEYDGTYLTDNPSDPDSKVIKIKDKKLFISFVMDKSGSMGWSDRFKKRVDFTNMFIDTLSNSYGEEILYDIVSVGATQLEETSAIQEGDQLYINIDARKPTRTTYTFTSKDIANAYINDIYVNNNNKYVVLNNSIGKNSIVCISNSDPYTSGTLIKESGLGDELIIFESLVKASVNNIEIISCGFKNLCPNKTYNISDIQIDNVDFIDIKSKNWEICVPNWEIYSIGQSPSMTIGANGPNNGDSLDIDIPIILNSNSKSEISIINHFHPEKEIIESSNVISSISIGDTNISVSNTNAFAIGNLIDISDGINTSFLHTITEISGQTITFSPPAKVNIYDNITFGGRIYRSVFLTPPKKFSGTTIMILIRDQTLSNSSPSQTFTFFFQSTNGERIEWDYLPQKEWTSPLFYWIGDTATFNFNLVDTDGNMLQDGVEIDLFVEDQKFVNSSNVLSNVTTNATTILINTLASVGDYVLNLNSVTGLEVGQNILITDYKNKQDGIIQSINNNSITLFKYLKYEFSPTRNAKIVIKYSKTYEDEDPNRIITLQLPYVDITPIYSEIKLDESYLKPFDPPQIEPTATYDELNYDEARTRSFIYNGATNKGNAVIRILPITEDILKSDKDKENDPQAILEFSTPEKFSEQILQNDSDANKSETTAIKKNMSFVGPDYTIESPIFLLDGRASSKMISYTQDFILNEINGLNLPITGTTNKIYSKKYTIYPYILFKDNYNIFKQQVPPFDVYFAARYYIDSQGDGQTIVGSKLPSVDTLYEGGLEISPPEIFDAPGIYATSSNTYSMTFTIIDKMTLISEGELIVRLYVNPMVTCEDILPILEDYNNGIPPDPQTTQAMNLIKGVSVNYKGSELDNWRKTVESNKLNTILNSLLDSLNHLSDEVVPPNIVDSASKILNTYNWAFLKKETIPVVNGNAMITIESLDYPCLLMTDASFAYSNGQVESVNKNYFFIGNPLFFKFFSTYALKPIPNQKYNIGGRLMWMNNAYGTIQDGTNLSIRTSCQAIPTISESIDGKADGIFIAPTSWTWQKTDGGQEIYPPAIPTIIGD